MKEQEFKKLLDQFFQGTLTEEEKTLLEKYDETLYTANRNLRHLPNDLDRREIKNSIWKKIKKSQKKKSEKIKIASIAAASIAIALISTLYVYLTSESNNKSFQLPNDKITLELDNGNIKVIDENGNESITDSEGNLVGKQSGNELVYQDESEIRKLSYNTLNVPYGKTFKLELSDGTNVHLNSGSSIKFPVNFQNGESRQVFISGEAYLNVAKDTLHPFVVKSEDLNVQVLGTEFNFSSYPEDNNTEVVLVEGSVTLYTDSMGFDINTNTLLSPSTKGSLNKNTQSITTKKVITATYTSWLDGKLVFRNMAFANILKKLERHYNVEIINENKELSKKLFNANFGNQALIDVLIELKENYSIDYVIEEQTVRIK